LNEILNPTQSSFFLVQPFKMLKEPNHIKVNFEIYFLVIVQISLNCVLLILMWKYPSFNICPIFSFNLAYEVKFCSNSTMSSYSNMHVLKSDIIHVSPVSSSWVPSLCFLLFILHLSLHAYIWHHFAQCTSESMPCFSKHYLNCLSHCNILICINWFMLMSVLASR
jgi:hypothetical protein